MREARFGAPIACVRKLNLVTGPMSAFPSAENSPPTVATRRVLSIVIVAFRDCAVVVVVRITARQTGTRLKNFQTGFDIENIAELNYLFIVQDVGLAIVRIHTHESC
jgi:hypothetical protein